nr:neurofilament heavy polypeptide isoform X3 [Ipomoea batatas]
MELIQPSSMSLKFKNRSQIRNKVGSKSKANGIAKAGAKVVMAVACAKDIMPIGKRLGEKVFADIALKLKPYLTQAVKSLDLSLHEYSKVVTSILEGTTIVVEHSSDHTLKNQLVS